MKKNVCYLLLAGLASLLTAEAQTNLPAASQPTDATNTPPPATMPATNEVSAAPETNPPAAAVMPATNEVAAPTAMDEAPATAETTEALASSETPALYPTIRISNVSITTAIESLARAANINYMLDPKIGYGQPDQNGQIKPEPQISIRWENISAKNALLALLDNYGLQLVNDKTTGIARITPKEPNAPPPLITRVLQLKYASVSNMTVAVESVLFDKRSKVLPDNRTSQLIVIGTDPEQQAVDTLIAQLDKPTKQVLIEAHFVEVDSSPESTKGIDWTKTLSAQTVTFGNGTLLPSSSTSTGIPGVSQTKLDTLPGIGFAYNTASGLTPDIGFINADGLNAVLSFLNSSADAQVVSTPRIVTLDNETAKLSVTRGYPVFNVQGGSANASGGSSVNYTNVGTTLEVTPRISANDYIWLKVVPQVSSFFGDKTESVNIGGGSGSSLQTVQLSAPQFDERSFETQVRIPNGNTLVMGGLVNDNPKTQTTKVPFLGDIPILGYAFRSEDKKNEKDNLIIFITPTIVQDSDFQPTSTDFLKSKPQNLSNMGPNPNSSWDNTKSDWSHLYSQKGNSQN